MGLINNICISDFFLINYVCAHDKAEQWHECYLHRHSKDKQQQKKNQVIYPVIKAMFYSY